MYWYQESACHKASRRTHHSKTCYTQSCSMLHEIPKAEQSGAGRDPFSLNGLILNPKTQRKHISH